MNGRMYDPVLARFLSPDPFVQMPDFSQNFNRYSYCLNNPFKYTDPSGEFFFIFPTVSWSKSGGISFGISAILGIPGVASVQAGIGYNIKNNDFSAYAGATAFFNTVYASVSSQNGWSVGWSTGISPQMGFPISTNFTSAGVNYNITKKEWSGNLSAWARDKNGWAFNPSVSAMFLEEQTTNLVRGQGFRSNQQVYEKIMFSVYNNPDFNWRQAVLDYFGFEGTYDPSLASSGGFDPGTGDIKFGDSAFGGRGNSYGRLRAIYEEELFHSKDYLIYKSQAPSEIEDLHAYEEWRAQMHLYKNQGLYLNSGTDWVERIRQYGRNSGLYYPIVGSKYSYSNNFSVKWWHFIYKIPRRW